jgi:hypothetical protein
MSDIKKWMKIMESVPATFPNQPDPHQLVKRDATVMVDPRIGGGTGRYMHSTPTGAMVDIKGIAQEMSQGDFSLPERDYEEPYRKGNDWFHMSVEPDTIGTMRDKPEFRAGDMVKVADVYGTVIGPGFGVFVAYSTSGTDCIISFDSKEIVVPTSNVGSVLEQNAKDNFDQLDNDGNLSPMSRGSENVKVEEPAMDHRDEFSKWMSAVEEALTSEGQPVAEDVPALGAQCGCGSWDCPVCFPDQDEMPGMQGAMDGMGGVPPEVVVVGEPMGMGAPEMGAEVCPTCGHSHEDGGMDHEMEVEIPFEDGSAGGMGSGGVAMGAEPMVDEEPMHFDQKPSLPRGEKGGVKLGQIVQKFVPADQAGEESPLTYGEDNLDENDIEQYGVPQDRDNEIITDAQMDEAMDMISQIKYMQQMGLSKSEQAYSEEQMADMNFSTLKKCYDSVMGTVSEEMPPAQVGVGAAPTGAPSMGSMPGGGSPASPGGNYAPGTAPTMPESFNQGHIMENVDKDVAAMLSSLKKYDKLTESVSPVLGMVTLGEKKGGKPEWLEKAEKKAEGKDGDSDSEGGELDESEEKGNPWEKLASDKKDDEKTSKTSKGGTVTKTDKGLTHKAGDKKEVKESADEADAEILTWMKRFASLGNMKGYGR